MVSPPFNPPAMNTCTLEARRAARLTSFAFFPTGGLVLVSCVAPNPPSHQQMQPSLAEVEESCWQDRVMNRVTGSGK